jgi:hypothetical protein
MFNKILFIMKTKLLKFSLAVFCMISTISLFAEGNNAPEGATNTFAKYYGQVIGSSRGAADALLYIDLEHSDGKIPEALVHLGYTVTVATDWYDFTNKLNTGNFGLAVGFNQNYQWEAWKPGLLTAFANYIANGGALVFNDWRMDNDFAMFFNAEYTGVYNQTPMHLDPSIEYNVSNPMPLTNPGWNVFSTGVNATGDAETLATFPNGNGAIIRSNNGKAIIIGYLTDTPLAQDRQQLFENLFTAVAPPPIPPTPVPLSNWALYVGIALMLTFVVIRFRRIF